MAPTSRRAVIAVSNYSFTDTSTLQISWIYSYCVPGSQQRSTKGNRASPSGCIVLLRTRTSLLHYSKRGEKISFAEQQYILIKKDKKIRDPVGGPGSSCSTALKRDDGPVRRLHQCLKTRGTTNSNCRKTVQLHYHWCSKRMKLGAIISWGCVRLASAA